MSVKILTDTTDIPITMIGEMSGLCYNSDIKDHNKNYKRGLECIRTNHGRTLEFPQIYIEFNNYSARVIREVYTHISGSPTRLQTSTRYVDYSNFEYIIPPTIEKQTDAKDLYIETMKNIASVLEKLEQEYNIKREDTAMLLPLGMTTKVIMRTNLRQLIDMSHQRLCTRAYWEFRKLMKDLIDALAFYSDEWKYLIEEEKIFSSKCKILGYCPEKHSCGKAINKKEWERRLSSNFNTQSEEWFE